MGMYDYLGCDQVKIFDAPVFHFQDRKNGTGYSLSFMGGELREFDLGDPVPCKTLWYRYPDIFLIADIVSIYDGYPKDDVFHLIQDGKYAATYRTLEDIPEDIFEKIDAVYDYIGRKLYRITSKDDLRTYIESAGKYQKLVREQIERQGQALKAVQQAEKEGDEKKADMLTELYFASEKEETKRLAEKYRICMGKFAETEEEKREEEKEWKFSLFGGYIDLIEKIMPHTSEYFCQEGYKESLLEEARRIFREIDLEEYFAWLNPSRGEKRKVWKVVKKYLHREEKCQGEV